MDGVKEKERPHALVKVVRVTAKLVEVAAFFEQQIDAHAPAERIERDIPLFSNAGNDLCQAAHEEEPRPFPVISRSTRSSSICDSTSFRLRPLSASASCAINKPNGAPRS